MRHCVRFAVAVAAKQLHTMELLCQAGVNVAYETKAGRSALLVAVNKDLLEVCTYGRSTISTLHQECLYFVRVGLPPQSIVAPITHRHNAVRQTRSVMQAMIK